MDDEVCLRRLALGHVLTDTCRLPQGFFGLDEEIEQVIASPRHLCIKLVSHLVCQHTGL